MKLLISLKSKLKRLVSDPTLRVIEADSLDALPEVPMSGLGGNWPRPA